MCGLVGFWRPSGCNVQASGVLVNEMASTLTHRGPDDEGLWIDEVAGVALAHRRLSIVDLSHAGHQPMVSSTGRYVVAFNGEIYNHLSVRRLLEESGICVPWKGHADTETLLAAIEAWGLESAIKRCVGMFAIALWDRELRQLSLVRDRMGEKPLYYGWVGAGDRRVFLFGSELKSLRVHPEFDAQIDRGAVALFLRHNYVPSPYSIYQGISKVEPGCILKVSPGGEGPSVLRYWDTLNTAVSCAGDPFKGSKFDAVEELERKLLHTIGEQMIADVPLGAFLSGGIDSSTIVSLMQTQSGRPVQTFTIGFHEEGFNEAEYAKAVADHLGTSHTELYVTARQAMEVIPKLPSLYDEPFSDSSQIPTYLVAELASRSVTVALSGDGGDELFGGYSRYTLAARTWERLSRVPMLARRGLARCITAISPAVWDRLLALMPFSEFSRNGGDRIHKAASVLDSASMSELYYQLVSHWHDPGQVVIGGVEHPTMLSALAQDLSGLGAIERMMALDAVTYLPDDILVKVDRAAMGVSLETRVPMLDHRIVEFAWSLPMEMKLNNGQGKWVLRRVLERHVPRELFERPKTGFGVPLGAWLRGPLRDWAEDLLSASSLNGDGIFNTQLVRSKWNEHLSGRRNWQYHIWDMLIFQAWKRSV